MSLAVVQSGTQVHLLSIEGGHTLQGRLSALGFLPGVEIEVLQNNFGGPLIIKLRGSRMALGRGMAQKLIVA